MGTNSDGRRRELDPCANSLLTISCKGSGVNIVHVGSKSYQAEAGMRGPFASVQTLDALLVLPASFNGSRFAQMVVEV